MQTQKQPIITIINISALFTVFNGDIRIKIGYSKQATDMPVKLVS